jgi:hypothetical protein
VGWALGISDKDPDTMGTEHTLPLVLVQWNDANVGGDDVVTLDNVDSFHKPTVVHTLGWLMKQDADGLTLVNEFYNECYRGRTYIPAGMVIDITPFKLTKSRGTAVRSARTKVVGGQEAQEP